jgi:hypothetical protein
VAVLGRVGPYAGSLAQRFVEDCQDGFMMSGPARPDDPGRGDSRTGEEYQSLRAESLQAKANQQSILQWSIGAMGIVAAATLALVASGVRVPARLDAVALALGIVLPGLLAAAFAVWIGEVERMERVGRFLRLREQDTWRWPPPAVTSERAFSELPIFWENLIATPRLGSAYGKNRIGAIGTSLLYAVSYTVSVAVAVDVLATARSDDLPRPLAEARGALIPIVILIALVILAMLGAKLAQIRRRAENQKDARSRSVKVPAPPGVTVVLPCLNEILALNWVLARMPEGYTPLIVDNGSTDGSRQFALQSSVRCIEETVRGVGPAVVAGLEYVMRRSEHEIVCVMDCDGTVDPSDLTSLVIPITLTAADVVIGARQGYDARSWAERVLSRMQAAYIRRNLGIAVRDMGSALAISLELLRATDAQGINHGNAWKIELLRRAHGLGARISQVEIDHNHRIGRSKITGTWRGKYMTIRDAIRAVRRPASDRFEQKQTISP